jgi:hypothetical protein
MEVLIVSPGDTAPVIRPEGPLLASPPVTTKRECDPAPSKRLD